MTEKEYATLPVYRVFLKCSIPNILSMIFSSIYMIVDGIFIGKYIGNVGMAAVNIAMPILMITFAMADMIAIGSSVKISIALGEENHKKANQIFSTSVMINLIFSAVFGGTAVFFADKMHWFIKGENLLAIYAGDYLRVMGYFAVLFIPLFAMDNYLRICGKTKLSMYINIGASLGNIFLDWLLIAKLGMGIEAAAYSTGITTSLGTLIALGLFASKKLTLRYSKPNLPLNEIWQILYNGSSEFLNKIAGSAVSILTNGFLLYFGGALGLAAYSIVMYSEGFIRSILYGIIDSMQPAISYNYGAGNYDRVRKIHKICFVVAGSISCLAVCLFLIFPHFFVGLFAEKGNLQIETLARTALILFAPSYLTTWYNIITSTFLTSLDRPKESLIVMTLNTIIFPLVSVVALGYWFQLNGVFLTPFVTQTATCCVSAYYWKKVSNQNMHKQITTSPDVSI